MEKKDLIPDLNPEVLNQVFHSGDCQVVPDLSFTKGAVASLLSPLLAANLNFPTSRGIKCLQGKTHNASMLTVINLPLCFCLIEYVLAEAS